VCPRGTVVVVVCACCARARSVLVVVFSWCARGVHVVCVCSRFACARDLCVLSSWFTRVMRDSWCCGRGGVCVCRALARGVLVVL